MQLATKSIFLNPKKLKPVVETNGLPVSKPTKPTSYCSANNNRSNKKKQNYTKKKKSIKFYFKKKNNKQTNQRKFRIENQNPK